MLFVLLVVAATAQTGTIERPGYDSAGKFTLFVIGDAGKPGAILNENAKALELEGERLKSEGNPVNAITFVGDNFYPVGLNHDKEVRHDLVNDVLGPVAFFLRGLGRKNVHAIPGNHDYYCDMFGPAPYGVCQSGNLYEMMIPVWTYYLTPQSVRYPVKRGSKDSIELIMLNSAYFMMYSREQWHYQTDSLRSLLKRSAANKSVKWRVAFTHHPPYTFGSHGGYRIWDAERRRIRYMGNCIDDRKDPIKYVQMFAGSYEDNCAPRYQYYNDTLLNTISESGAQVHLLASGHDHNLQLLAQNGGKVGAPKIFVVTGAGSKVSEVRTSFHDVRRGLQYFAHPINTPEARGTSIYGFLGLQIEEDMMKLWFVNGETKQRANMGGKQTFWINRKGYLVNSE